MSFIGAVDKGVTYTPGFFIADDDENVTRETRQFAANSALVVTSDNGAKHIPMGTAYPSNDGNAIGITYEDVDVTNGDMPGSVVTKADVYEDRLAITGADYDSVTLKNLVSPKAQGWYESDGQVSPTYTLSTDTTVNTSKTYYTKSGDTYSAVSDYAAVLNPQAEGWYESDGQLEPTYTLSTDTTVNTSKTYYEKTGDTTYAEVDDYAAVLNPKEEGWYESDGGTGYVLSTDTEGDKTKTYYEKSDVRLASAAKSALEALGFRFIATAPAVTRPY